MKKSVSVRFLTLQPLMVFIRKAGLSNYVVVENVVTCDLTSKQIQLAEQLGGTIFLGTDDDLDEIK